MKRIFHILIMALAGIGLSSVAQGHPTSYQGALSLMSLNSEEMNELFTHYSFNPRISLGAKFVRMKERGQESLSVFPQLSLLLARWNHPLFQANVYGYGGFGLNRVDEKNGTSLFYGAEADIEDRRYYFSSSFQSLRLSEFRNHLTLKARAGVSAYLAEYSEPSVWGIVQYEFHPGSDTVHSVTPLMRVFYKNALIEAGSSLKGSWLLNLMIHY